MTNKAARSDQVVEGYKRHKLGISALHEIQRLLQGFEQEHEINQRLAWIGRILLVASVITIVCLYIIGISDTTLAS